MKLSKLKNKIQKQKDEIELLALTDPMTKLYNRRYFTQTSKHLLSLAKRDKTELSILMIDIDNFKSINDTYGHKIGDDVIIALSSMMLTISRKSDIVCRFGGEEFLILFPETDIDGALVIAQKIREETLNIDIKTEDNKIKFTISIGLSKIDIQNDENIEISIKKADDALYKAKNNGKNRVCLYNNDTGDYICLQD